MSIPKIENLANTLAKEIVAGMKITSAQRHSIQIDNQGNLSGYPVSVFDHQGLYGFCVEQNDKTAVIYIGKSERDSRLRQHLTCKNKDGTALKDSVRNKNKNIKEALKSGFSVYLCLYANNAFQKASLSCIEIASSLHAKSDMKSIFPDVKHWNERIG